jgi:hypothetical protein
MFPPVLKCVTDMYALSEEKRKSSEGPFNASHWNVSNGQHNDLPARASASRQPHLSRGGRAQAHRLMFARTGDKPLMRKVCLSEPRPRGQEHIDVPKGCQTCSQSTPCRLPASQA